jgi:hypothetical protein
MNEHAFFFFFCRRTAADLTVFLKVDNSYIMATSPKGIVRYWLKPIADHYPPDFAVLAFLVLLIEAIGSVIIIKKVACKDDTIYHF